MNYTHMPQRVRGLALVVITFKILHSSAAVGWTRGSVRRISEITV